MKSVSGKTMLIDNLKVMRSKASNHFDGSAVPLRPATLRRLKALISPKIEAGALAELAAHDPGLAFHLLRLANSNDSRTGAPIFRLEEAIFFISGDDIRTLASQQSRGPVEAIEILGAHSRLTALVARRLAQFTTDGDPVRAYIGGLLHDLGKLALLSNGATGSHSTVGRELALGARLPMFIVDAISNHHRPAAAECEGDLVQLISVADQLACGLAESKSADRTAASDMLRSGIALFQQTEPSTFLNVFAGTQWFPMNTPAGESGRRDA